MSRQSRILVAAGLAIGLSAGPQGAPAWAGLDAAQPPAEEPVPITPDPSPESPAEAPAPAPAPAPPPGPSTGKPASQPTSPQDQFAELAGTVEAKATFRLMLESLAQARTLVFHSKTTNTGSLAGHNANTDSTVRMRRLPERGGAWQLRVSGLGVRKAEDAPTQLDVVWGPEGASWLDYAKQSLSERPVAQSAGPLVQMALTSVPTQLIEKIPFSKEIGAQVVTLDSIETVDGVECQVLTFKPRKGSSTTRVWVGTSDHLPRKFERASELKNYANTTVVEFSDFRPNEPLTADDFKIELPDGFSRETTFSSPRAATPRTPGDAAVQAASGNQGPATAERGNETRPPPAPPAPAFDLQTPSGDHVTLAKLRGRVVVLYFWGTWNLRARAGIAEAQKIHEEMEDAKVRVLAISVRERNRDAPIEFLKSAARTVTLLLDGEKTAADYGISIYPTFVVLDANGSKVGVVEGFKSNATPEDVRTLITKAQSVAVTAVDEPAPAGDGH